MDNFEFIDVSETAVEVGHGFNTLKAPVLLTKSLWDICVQWEQSDTDAQGGQEQDARLWDVLFVCGTTLSFNLHDFVKTMRHAYSIFVVPRDGTSTAASKAELVAIGNLVPGSLVIDLVQLHQEEELNW